MRRTVSKLKKIQYYEPFSNHFNFCHVVDDHNNIRYQLPAIETTWATHRWAFRVFAFILAVLEVNCFLVFKYSVWGSKVRHTLDGFWTDLAWTLIGNDYLNRERGHNREGK